MSKAQRRHRARGTGASAHQYTGGCQDGCCHWAQATCQHPLRDQTTERGKWRVPMAANCFWYERVCDGLRLSLDAGDQYTQGELALE